ncbi:hypothetical protein LTR22_014392 [Elasticomyces elasticus]|nr:hypothetical protein LTR22_014392 [Elasticomyces elasticus]KAK4904484.1 hypothetical protein LTR49_026086 [Elasticomyces elasticus]KAK5739747.1 hypothetical protein LTS12_025172 [Elasticomyces elasticus]
MQQQIINFNMTTTNIDVQVNNHHKDATDSNRKVWDAIADWWELKHSESGNDGTDMFTECLLPQVKDLASWKEGETVLDLGAGSGIICRMFAKNGAKVTGLDYSQPMLDKARKRAESDGLAVEYDFIDLMDIDNMKDYASKHPEKFDIITISTTLKSLPSLEPIAEALPLLLKPGGRVVNVDLHPAFSKPAGHRGMEVFEDPETGKQQLQTYIKVMRYLNIPPSQSEAVRGQPEPLTTYHRPFWSLLDPFFRNGLVMDAMREPAFETKGGDPEHPQSYHNFPQTPMLLAFRLKHR